MLKPVYFGNSREDQFLLECTDKITNFSDWVKNKLCEEFNVKIVGRIENSKVVDTDLEIIIDKNEITKDIVDIIEVEEKIKIETQESKKEINLEQWTL